MATKKAEKAADKALSAAKDAVNDAKKAVRKLDKSARKKADALDDKLAALRKDAAKTVKRVKRRAAEVEEAERAAKAHRSSEKRGRAEAQAAVQRAEAQSAARAAADRVRQESGTIAPLKRSGAAADSASRPEPTAPATAASPKPPAGQAPATTEPTFRELRARAQSQGVPGVFAHEQGSAHRSTRTRLTFSFRRLNATRITGRRASGLGEGLDAFLGALLDQHRHEVAHGLSVELEMLLRHDLLDRRALGHRGTSPRVGRRPH